MLTLSSKLGSRPGFIWGNFKLVSRRGSCSKELQIIYDTGGLTCAPKYMHVLAFHLHQNMAAVAGSQLHNLVHSAMSYWIRINRTPTGTSSLTVSSTLLFITCHFSRSVKRCSIAPFSRSNRYGCGLLDRGKENKSVTYLVWSEYGILCVVDS